MMLITIISYRGANTTTKLNGKRKNAQLMTNSMLAMIEHLIFGYRFKNIFPDSDVREVNTNH